MSPMIDLKEKIAVVTGATAGIGRAIAIKLAAHGASVICVGTNAERGKEVVSVIEAAGGKARFLSLNVADFDSVTNAFKQILSEEGSLDILVNNAGITRDGLLARMKENDWDDVLAVNLKSCYNTCKAVTRPMMKQRSGSIINISSVVGLTGNPGQVNYAASKSGMLGVTRSLAKELAPRGVRVNAVAPGYIQTRMTGQLDEGQKEAILGQIPLGRIGKPEEIANIVLILASDMSSYMTGQVLAVDGGMVTC